ncbi:MAG: aminotransferase class V-fold PLP-dependent enzyme [bacterium]|nr:aminotransferase class V-fold PLP-dependent enzyme [bacterium]
MEEHALPRRTFLKQAGIGLAAPFLAQLPDARKAFADELAATPAATAEALRDRYTLDPGITYLNHASIGTIPRPVQEAQRRYLELCETNPWLHMWGGAWEEPREEVRRKAAALLGCADAEVSLTHNTTETFNLLAHGLPLGSGDEVVMSSLNHAGASICWEHLAAVRGFRVRRFDFPVREVPRLGRDDVLNFYDEHLGPRSRVLVFPQVDNIVGLRHPVRELAALARAKGVRYVAVDAAQTVGMIPVDVGEMGVDVYATSPHKWLQAPKGLGLAYLRRELHEELRPMWVSWGQQRWQGTVRVFEDYGTRNLAEVLTLGDALDFQEKLGAGTKEAHHKRLWEHTRAAVESDPRLVWRSPASWELGAALYAVEVRGENSAPLFERLFHEHGFVFRPFSTDGLETLRLSPNVANTTEEIDRLLSLLS